MPNHEAATNIEVNEAFNSLENGWQEAVRNESEIHEEAKIAATDRVRDAKEATEQARSHFFEDVSAAVNDGRVTLKEAREYLSQWFEVRSGAWEAVEECMAKTQPGTPLMFTEENVYRVETISQSPSLILRSSYGESVRPGLSIATEESEEPVEFETYSEPKWGNVLIGKEQIEKALLEHIDMVGARSLIEVIPAVREAKNFGIVFDEDPVKKLESAARRSVQLFKEEGSDKLRLSVYYNSEFSPYRMKRYLRTVKDNFPDAFDLIEDKAAVAIANSAQNVDYADNKLLINCLMTLEEDNFASLKPVEYFAYMLEMARRGEAVLNDEEKLKNLLTT